MVNTSLYEIESSDYKCESLFVCIHGFGKLCVGVCYRNPNAEREEFEDLSKVTKHTDNAAISRPMGDFNYGEINYGDDGVDSGRWIIP